MADTILVLEFASAGGLQGHPDEATLLPAGRAMRDAVAADLRRLPRERVHRVQVADRVAASARDVLAVLAEQSRRHDRVWVIAPESGGTLAACCAGVGPARWLGSSAATLHTTSSKTRTLARLSAVGLRTPLDFDGPGQARRWVVKPDVGAGAVGAVVLENRITAQTLAAQRQAAGEAVTLQPWVEGEPMSLSLLCGGQRPGRPAEVLSLNRQHLRLDTTGRLDLTGVARTSADSRDPRWPALQTLADAVAHALPGLRGFVGVDLVWHARHGPVPIEVNARVTQAYAGLSAALGRNLAGEVLDVHR